MGVQEFYIMGIDAMLGVPKFFLQGRGNRFYVL
jgi:hypothetical protein